ncbi:MAG: hypothetical protein CMJ48_03035 [Planctomycetaceae bacterium]|nr:hypothetical protein [Planctomycetaceae bacterium]
MTRLLLCLTTLTVLVPGSLFAQGSRRVQGPTTRQRSTQATQPTTRRPRPSGGVLQVQKLTLEFERILKKWSDESAKIKKLKGQHTQFEYDTVYNVEKRTEGVLYFEAPDKGRIDMKPASIKGQVSSKKDKKTGKPFRLVGGDPQRWVCDGKLVMRIDDKEKTYEKVAIPPEAQGKNMMDGPLPFLFGMPPEKLKRRYLLKLQVNNTERIIIAAKPRTAQDAQNYKEAQIILNPKTYLPSAIRLVNPTGNSETVYVFKDLVVNGRKSLNPFAGSPFKPSLFRYKQAQINRTAAQQGSPGRGPTRPAPRTAANQR